MDHVSSEAREPKTPLSVAPGGPWPGGAEEQFDDQLLHALNQVSEVARCCLLLRVVEQLPYAEISELMEIPEGTAMSHVHRAKANLRKQLDSSRDTYSET